MWSHTTLVGQWGTYLWSHTTPVGQSIIVPISIRLANRVPICGPIQHQLASQSLSPSQSGWPMRYLFVVPCNTGWPVNHCLHPNQVGQRGTYLWSHATPVGQWGTYLWSHTTPVGQSIIVPISIRLANGAPICGLIQQPTGWVLHWMPK